MPAMEISIKWNVCRVCLVEERRNYAAKYTPIDAKIASQIHEISKVQMETNDNLPDKICRKCLLLLKYACHFSTTCRNSDEYLQSIIRKTKSATSMLKLDKQRERSVHLMEEIFNEDTEFSTINLLDDEQEQPKLDVDFGKNIDDGESKLYQTQLIRTASDASSVLNVQETGGAKMTSFLVSQEKHEKNIDRSGISPNIKPLKRQENVDEIIDEDYVENELDALDSKASSCEQNNLRDVNNKAETSMHDMGYIHDSEEVRVDTLDIIHDQSGYNSNDDNQVNEMDSSTIKIENHVTPVSDEDEQHNETDPSDVFYIIKIEEPVNEIEESSPSQKMVATADNTPELEDNVHLISDLSNTECCEGEEERIYESTESNKSVVQLEEYLIEESEAETIVQQSLEISEHQVSKRLSPTTISEPQYRNSSSSRKRVNDAYMFSCDVCGNLFTSRSLRNYHMRIHRNERNFECELCFKRFTAAFNLTAHMRIHTGEKPYECKYCLRRFTDRSTHIKHERIHTNEKPFQCNICGKSFSLSTTLRTHEKVHTNEKPFKCAPCNKSFKLPHQLKSHLRTNQHKNVLIVNEMETVD